MSKWLKLSEIPKDFWGECFVAWDSCGVLHVDTSVVMIRNFNDQGMGRYLGVMWYCYSLKEWFDFRSDLDHRLMIVEFPNISEEDFK